MNQLIDRLGNWNPQLVRELKGRVNFRNLLIVTCISFLFQLVVIHFNYSYKFNLLAVFTALSELVPVVFLLGGIYLIIDDIGQEKRQQTLLFIQLSPQSSSRIALGKILGVPCLVTFGALLTIPLQLCVGYMIGIPLYLILGSDLLVFLSSFFIFAIALLFGLVSSHYGRLQAGLGTLIIGGLLGIFLSLTKAQVTSPTYTVTDAIFLLSPSYYHTYLLHHFNFFESDHIVEFSGNLQWYFFPLNKYPVNLLLFSVIHYTLMNKFIGQMLSWKLDNLYHTFLSKKQSYWTGGITMIWVLGFSCNLEMFQEIATNYPTILHLFLLFFQFLLSIFLICTVTPNQTTLQAWIIHRRQRLNKRPLWEDLVWGEKSPAIVAIILNILITSGIILIPLLLIPIGQSRLELIQNLLLQDGLILAYASLIQWVFLHQKKNGRFNLFAGLIIIPATLVVSVCSVYVWGFIATDQLTLHWVLFGQGLEIVIFNLDAFRKLRQLGKKGLVISNG